MTEMTINVKVHGCARLEVGISPQLEQLLTRLLGPKEQQPPQNEGWYMPQVSSMPLVTPLSRRWEETQPQQEQQTEPNPAQPTEAEPTPQEPPAVETPPDIQDRLPFDEPEPPEVTQPPVGEPQQQTAPLTFTESVIRKIMDDTRKRVLGPDFKTHPLYKRLNGQFKTEASFASNGRCDTPTKLPELGAEICIAFRNGCESLAIDPLTNDIISKPPF